MKIRTAIVGFVLPTFAALSGPAAAADGGTLAADHGCLNCHGTQTHPSEAPLLKELAAKLARKGDSPEALKHALEEMREKNTVHGHVFASGDAALEILRWMAHGAKP